MGLGILLAIIALIAVVQGIGMKRTQMAELREREARVETERGMYHSKIGEAALAVRNLDLTHAREALYSCPEPFRNWECLNISPEIVQD